MLDLNALYEQALARQRRQAPNTDRPLLCGPDGAPAECSSCTDLSVLPVYIFDVLGYYRELGVRTDATRKELRLAYQAKDGPNNPRLTYIFHQLLNPEVRRDYDATPLGELFLDKYVREWLQRKAHARLSRDMARAALAGREFSERDADERERQIYSDLGLDEESVDRPPVQEHDPWGPAKFHFAYYLFKTSLVESFESLGRLALWQQALVRALSSEKIHTKFSVGYHGMPHRWLRVSVGYRTVFLLNIDHEPTDELAAAVARQERIDQDGSDPRMIEPTEG